MTGHCREVNADWDAGVMLAETETSPNTKDIQELSFIGDHPFMLHSVSI